MMTDHTEPTTAELMAALYELKSENRSLEQQRDEAVKLIPGKYDRPCVQTGDFPTDTPCKLNCVPCQRVAFLARLDAKPCPYCGHSEEHVPVAGCTHETPRSVAEDEKFCGCKKKLGTLEQRADELIATHHDLDTQDEEETHGGNYMRDCPDPRCQEAAGVVDED